LIKQDTIKKIGVAVLVLTVTILTYKFIAWNAWKVKEAVILGKRILNEHSAVNLTLGHGEQAVFKKSFPFNPKGNFYIINTFDITSYIEDGTRVSLDVGVNGTNLNPPILHKLTGFYILECRDYYFVFTFPGIDYPHIPALEKSLRGIIETIKQKSIRENTNKINP